jgi:hypothetical protein
MDIYSFLVTDAAGHLVLSGQIDHKSKLSINTSTWKAGCYFIKLIGSKSTSLQRFMIVR